MQIPQHIAFIMDGNGRWARQKGLGRSHGHREGAERVKEIVREAKRLGVKVVTVFAFSTENWSRPKREIQFLMSYLDTFLATYRQELMKEDIRLRFIGRRDRFLARTVRGMEALENKTHNNKSMLFNIALDYGGRWDIINAAKRIARDGLSEAKIDETVFRSYLALAGVPEPDLLIRTSGEFRISNFLIWDLAYSEFYFTPVLWPDFGAEHLREAVSEYSRRQRRFGSADE